MSGESRKGAARDQDQMRDQRAFREDPRGRQEVSEQQPETEPSSDGEGRRPEEPDQNRSGGTGRDDPGETGRDDPGEATGNPPSAG